MSILKLLFSTIALFISFIGICQDNNYKIDWGSEYKAKGIHFLRESILGATQDAYYIIDKSNLKNKKLLKYDFNHKLMKEIPYKITHEELEIDFSTMITIDKVNHLLGSSYNKNKKKVSLYSMDLNKIESSERNINKIIEYDYNANKFIHSTDDFNKDAVGFEVSEDSSLIVFTYIDYLIEKNNRKEKYSVVVLNNKMQLLWRKTIDLPYLDKDVFIERFSINNQGIVQFLLKINSQENRLIGMPRHDYKLYNISEQNVKLIDLDINKAKPLKPFYFNLKNGDLYVIGYYNERNSKKDKLTTNIFVSKYNKDMKLSFHNKISLSDKVFLLDERGNSNKRMKLDYTKFRIRDVLINYNDKSIIAISEYGSKFLPLKMTGQLLVMSLSFDGKYNWATDIEKKLSVSNAEPFELSYLFGYNNQNLYFIFTTNKSFKERKKLDLKKKMLTSITDIVCVNRNGFISDQRVLFASSETKLSFNTLKSIHLGKSKFLLYLSNTHQQRKVGLLQINE